MGSVANNYSTGTKTSGSLTVWKTAGVAAGDLVVLTLQLSGTAATGTVSGTDVAGNQYAQAASVADGAGNRLVLLTGIATRALGVDDRITVTFPTATTYRLAGDELRGVSSVDQVSTATGTASTYSSGLAGTSAGGDAAFGAVSLPSAASGPTWATGWQSAGSYANGSQQLGRAYRLPVSGSLAATGTAGGAWLAAVVTLRP